ncbi:MAG: MBL fold metallo-hydrolase [Candidatus Nanopelagicales bacterium]
MRVRIHRGASEIGGNCVELEAADGSRLLLDLGRPLTAGWDEEVPLPDVAGLTSPDPSLRGVVISHPHLDHYGLVADLPAHVPVYVGEKAADVIEAARFFSFHTGTASGRVPRPSNSPSAGTVYGGASPQRPLRLRRLLHARRGRR